MKKQKKSTLDIFSITFCGEFVEILTPMYQKQIKGSEEGVEDNTTPIVIQGYILDIDDERLYLGDTPEEISQTILKSDARIVRIIKIQDQFEDILDHMELPSRKDRIN